MRLIWIISIAFCLLYSCKRNQNQDPLTENTEFEFDVQELPIRVAVNTESMAILEEWPEYVTFDYSFDAIYNTSNNEDLILVIENLIEKQKLWEESTYPEKFDIPQIKSRQRVLKTYLLKVKAALDYKSEFLETTVEMIQSYNALRIQFNVVMNSTLDPKLLFDE